MEDIDNFQIIVEKILEEEDLSLLNLTSDQLLMLYTLAYHLYENGKYTDSKKIFRFLTICEPYDRRYWMGLAASLLLLKDYSGALECYGVAAVQDPNDPYVHLYAADCLFAQGQMEKGIKTLESAISAAKNSKNSSLLMQLENMHFAWSNKSINAPLGD